MVLESEARFQTGGCDFAVTSERLGQSYFWKARSRLKILPVLLQDEDYSDVGPLLLEHRGRIPAPVQEDIKWTALWCFASGRVCRRKSLLGCGGKQTEIERPLLP